ncbi:citrate lyase acyl carrier protein [Lacticaseibacillus baoqingensis]|uniref:Citrate lyase acyl carrier protein n=1 Tax=Lacticaseibacillus baoqingensis TaxID=2486013 RepID=A0ABW4EA36_9LACO|nr:citrate lyase acyl carrier protein [Lacticaseibacillus baoqingensis]
MQIKHEAIAGTLESSDAQVTVRPAPELSLHISSSVLNQYGRQIKAVAEQTLKRLAVERGTIEIVDKGALDCTLKARIEAAIYRSADQSAAGIAWEVLA